MLSGGRSPAKSVWFGGFRTFFQRRKAVHAQASVLERLRVNLQEEQKVLAELDFVVYTKLLDPVQVAKCVLAAYPRHCDVVSLLNVLAPP